MFKKRSSWYRKAGKALLFAGFLYKVSGLFQKSTDKNKKNGNKDSLRETNKNIRRMRSALNTLRRSL